VKTTRGQEVHLLRHIADGFAHPPSARRGSRAPGCALRLPRVLDSAVVRRVCRRPGTTSDGKPCCHASFRARQAEFHRVLRRQETGRC
jgi:hypothetical protein